MWILRSATIVAFVALFATGAHAQYFWYYGFSSSTEPSYTSSLAAGARKDQGPIKRGYINKYGHVVVTEREKSAPDAGPGEPVTQPARPAPRASR